MQLTGELLPKCLVVLPVLEKSSRRTVSVKSRKESEETFTEALKYKLRQEKEIEVKNLNGKTCARREAVVRSLAKEYLSLE